MDENIKIIDKYATRIKEVLNKISSPTSKDIINEGDFDIDEFYLGLGWLANENERVNLEEITSIKDLNETKKNISNVLENKSKKNVATIAKNANLTSKEVYVALGSFAQQNKLIIFNGKILQTKYSLKQ